MFSIFRSLSIGFTYFDVGIKTSATERSKEFFKFYRQFPSVLKHLNVLPALQPICQRFLAPRNFLSPQVQLQVICTMHSLSSLLSPANHQWAAGRVFKWVSGRSQCSAASHYFQPGLRKAPNALGSSFSTLLCSQPSVYQPIHLLKAYVSYILP